MTLLEWYVTGWDYLELMNQCEEFIGYLAERLNGGPELIYQRHTVDLRPPWDRLSVDDAFRRYSGMTAQQALDGNRFDAIMGQTIEPRLGFQRPVFLYDYPARRGALARIKPSNPSVAERFELYIAGLELCNAFTELIDPTEQRERFKMENRARKEKGQPIYPTADPFLHSLEMMPPAAGNALGLDRLVMLFTDAESIDDVIAFTPEEL
jgi:lysyl-tRNA synthetase class 2